MRRLILAVALCLTLVGHLPAPEARAARSVPVASITAVLHSGLLLRSGTLHSAAATPFTPLFSGDRLRTGRGQHTAILLRDGSQFLLNENTDLGIAFPILRLYHGEIFGRVPHSGERHVVVRTDAAVAAVEGTQFDISAGLPGSPAHTVLTVVQGTVSLSTRLGSVLVRAAQQATANPNTAPSQPVVVAVPRFTRWTVQGITVLSLLLPPHFATPAAAAAAGGAAQARLTRSPGDVRAHLALADALADKGAAAAARVEYRRALALLPVGAHGQRARAEVGVAATDLVLGDLAGAGAAANAALILDRDNLWAGLLRGSIALAGGDVAAALAGYVQMRARHPREALPWAAMGVALALQRQDGAATAALTTALRLQPAGWVGAVVLMTLGFLASLQGNSARARSYDRRAVVADPWLSLAWTALGSDLVRLGRYGEALQPLAVATRLGSPYERALALDVLGAAQYRLGQMHPALASFRAALALNGADAVAASGAGEVAVALGDGAAALAYARLSVELAPAATDLRAGYAAALSRAHQDALAEAVCRGALRDAPLGAPPFDAVLYAILGSVLDAEGRAAAARAAYARSYALRPRTGESAEVLALAGELAQVAGHLAEARADLRRAVALPTADYSTWQTLASVEEDLHDDRAAIAAATRAVALNPAALGARTTLANAYYQVGDDRRAAAQYRAIVRLSPHALAIHGQLSQIAQRHGDLPTARTEILAEIAVQAALLTRSPRNGVYLASDWAALGTIDDGLHQPRQALDAYAQAVRHAPTTGSYYVSLGADQLLIGWTALAHTSFATAVRLTTAAIRRDPRDETLYYWRASAEEYLGVLGAAEADLRRAMALNPGDAAVHGALGDVLERAGNRAAARDQYTVALGLLKDRPRAALPWWLALGRVLDELGAYTAALGAYRHALALDPHGALARDGLGFELLRTRRTAAARAEFQMVVALNPHDPFAYFWLALIDEQAGRTAQALAELHQQLAVNGQVPALLATDYRAVGLIEARHRRWRAAVRAFQRVIALGQGTDQDDYDLGSAQERAGDAAGALAALQRAHARAARAGHSALAAAACAELAKLGRSCKTP